MRQNVLLLQGPVGPFFRRLAGDLEQNGFRVFKINFNGGDRIFFRGDNAHDFTGVEEEWEDYLTAFIRRHEIGRIYLFGDCRYYHKVARKVADEMDVRTFVFEEGYIRPNFVTLEEKGVNGNSAMIGREIDYSAVQHATGSALKYPDRVFRNMVLFAMTYYIACALLWGRFPYYAHHRPLNPLSEGGKWILAFVRKIRYRVSQRHLLKFFTERHNKHYFLCPLQVHCDMQISAHSPYTSVEHFIGEVVDSFARHADARDLLIFKHHPMDRGYTDYTTLITKLAHEYDLEGRLYYIHDLELPALLHGARGSVLINSTVGMSSLLHGTPVKTMGTAIYDREGLSAQVPLDAFWQNPGTADKQAYAAFRDYLIYKNQINGSFYRKLKGSPYTSGLEWQREMLLDHSYLPDRVDSARPPALQVVGGRDLPRTAAANSGNAGKLAS